MKRVGKNRLPSYRELVDQLVAQGIVILELREDSARRDKLAIANSIARTMREDLDQHVQATAKAVDEQIYGDRVREPTEIELLRQEVGKIHEELREHGNAISTITRDKTEPVLVEDDISYCAHCGHYLNR